MTISISKAKIIVLLSATIVDSKDIRKKKTFTSLLQSAVHAF